MRRREVAMFGVILGGMIVVCIGAGTGIKPLVGAGTVIAGASMAIGLIENQRVGIIRTNWGIFRRSDCRLCFRLQLGFWWVVTLLWTLGGVLRGLGRI